MSKTILITGATDGIGLRTATMLARAGHTVLLHGRNPEKLERVAASLSAATADGRPPATLCADLASPAAIRDLAAAVRARFEPLDVLVHNAGVYRATRSRTAEGLDVRFMVNAVAPAMLTAALAGHMAPESRVVSLSSAAQAPVELDALRGAVALSDHAAYAQSKLALTMWSHRAGLRAGRDGPLFIAVNPSSMLGTNMVKTAFGVPGKSVDIGARIVMAAAVDPAFAGPQGRYYDGDQQRFAPPHPDVARAEVCRAVTDALAACITRLGGA